MIARTMSPDQVVADLRRGAVKLATMLIAERRMLLQECIKGVEQVWPSWVQQAWDAKKIPEGHPARAEDLLTGPVPVLRYLHLLDQTYGDIERFGKPRLPGAPSMVRGRLHVPVFPTHQLFDRLLFGPVRGFVRMQPEVDPDSLFDLTMLPNATSPTTSSEDGTGQNSVPQVCLVLGAGNVSSIPMTDALTKIFQENQAVLLKVNPVNDYVGPVCEQAFAKLVDAGLLRIVRGGSDVGAHWVAHDDVDQIHMTGSDRTHDAIVWGGSTEAQAKRKRANDPRLKKRITSELGNVSPWIIVPGRYSKRQLQFQVENIAASIANNASFNCIATKMLITSRHWPQRSMFLDMLKTTLANLPKRHAYYPGACERFESFSGQTAASEALPWTLLVDADPNASPHLFQEESFVCVCAETSLRVDDPQRFLHAAIRFANERMWGTLSAAMTVPQSFERSHRSDIDLAIESLRYGIVGINQWPGVSFALMSTPWGGFPGSTLQDVQSGLGYVHNTFLLDRPEKSVLISPLTILPKPLWFSTHRRPLHVAEALVRLYLQPTWSKIPRVLSHALLG